MTYYSRNDGRQPSDLRNVALAVGQLSRADGSARFSFGEPKTHRARQVGWMLLVKLAGDGSSQ